MLAFGDVCSGTMKLGGRENKHHKASNLKTDFTNPEMHFWHGTVGHPLLKLGILCYLPAHPRAQPRNNPQPSSDLLPKRQK